MTLTEIATHLRGWYPRASAESIAGLAVECARSMPAESGRRSKFVLYDLSRKIISHAARSER